MTDRIFQYDELVLQRCATSPVAHYVALSEADPTLNFDDTDIIERYIDTIDVSDQYCKSLLQQYMEHYNRPQSEPLIHISRNNIVTSLSDINFYQVGSIMRNFIRNAITVHRHNSETAQRWHRLRLNRFSDQDLRYIFHPNTTTTTIRHYEEGTAPNTNGRRNSRRLNQVTSDTLHGSIESMKVPIVHLSSFDEIENLGMEWYPTDKTAAGVGLHQGFVKHMNKYTKRKTDHIQFDLYPSKLRIPTDDIISSNEHMDDDHRHSPTKTNEFYKSEVTSDMDGSLVYIGRNKKQDIAQRDNGIYSTNLNWATSNNPDGVPIVHDPIDQGSCGSCWALSATGSIEANAARRIAYSTFQNTIHAFTQSTTDSMEEIYRNATIIAQNVERQSMDRLNLSIQELIDCDTAVDQGCVGGNPLLAFYFVHKYGLTSSDQYPYAGAKGKCHKRSANSPVATVESWGILPPNSERHMELVLRHIGPIAVGFNGGDPTFLSYSGGVYYNKNCHHRSNHALLVVGYGEEEHTDDNGNIVNVPYWIARNSWGTGWGENGYVRIHREKGTKGEPGQCGIACSPSVALGGTLLKQTNGNFKGSDIYNVNQLRSSGINNPTEATNDPSHPLEIVIWYTALEKFCIRLGHQLDNNSRCGRFADFVSMHRAMVLGATGLLATLLVVVWPLTLDCRRRAHRLRMRKLQQQLERENDVLREIQHDETSTLMSQNGVADTTTYGTSTDRAAH